MGVGTLPAVDDEGHGVGHEHGHEGGDHHSLDDDPEVHEAEEAGEDAHVEEGVVGELAGGVLVGEHGEEHWGEGRETIEIQIQRYEKCI